MAVKTEIKDKQLEIDAIQQQNSNLKSEGVGTEREGLEIA